MTQDRGAGGEGLTPWEILELRSLDRIIDEMAQEGDGGSEEANEAALRRDQLADRARAATTK